LTQGYKGSIMVSDMKTKRKSAEIIYDMQSLLNELSVSINIKTPIHKKNEALSSPATFSGPSGGIRLLLREGFCKEPKTLTDICAQLRQEGFNYSNQVISVALLRLVRDRTMVRIPATGEGKKKWIYAERK